MDGHSNYIDEFKSSFTTEALEMIKNENAKI